MIKNIEEPRFLDSEEIIPHKTHGLTLSEHLDLAIKDKFRKYVSQEHPILKVNDIRLALEWSERATEFPLENKDIQTFLNWFGKDYELGKMLSARCSEIAAVNFLTSLGHKVKDISIEQVTEPTSSLWSKCDIKSDDEFIDVKNSRQTRQNENNYTEHTVQHAKQVEHKPVKILGVLSRYLWPKNMGDFETEHTTRNLRILGFADPNIDQKLRAKFESENLTISFHRFSQTGLFFPAWVFDYPKDLYYYRYIALQAIKWKHSVEELVNEKGNNYLSVCLAAGINPLETPNQIGLKNWQRNFIQLLMEKSDRGMIALPDLYLSILSHFLDLVVGGDNEEFHPNMYRNLVFVDGFPKNPLFILDPLETIDSLIKALNTLWEGDHERIKNYSRFRLENANILLGRRKDDPAKEWSLIAYCGGRNPKDGGKCGRMPLVLGQHHHCPRCGKLICDKCGFCSDGCSENKNEGYHATGSRSYDLDQDEIGDFEIIPGDENAS